jgi:hypothetical protein
MGDYVNAEAQATAVINNSSLYSLSSLASTFKMNSSETIWSLQPVRSGTQANTGDGALFILPSTGPNANINDVYLSNSVITAFEAGDQRRSAWVDSVIVGNTIFYYAFKYKIGAINTTTQEYVMVLRLAEQYLIRAEARAQQNNINGAQSDLNMIRSRAGLSPTAATTQYALLASILHERQVELFTEWGHRWFHLKRTKNIDAIMTTAAAQKGGAWGQYKALYPIPISEINKDPNLIQNTGY